MIKGHMTRDDLLSEVEILRARLAEAEETLRAIRDGEVDALVVGKPKRERIYSPGEQDRHLRVLLDSITEGAAAMTRDGIILFCNETLSRMARVPSAKVTGTPFSRFVSDADLEQYESFLEESGRASGKGEMTLKRGDGTSVRVSVSGKSLLAGGTDTICLVVSDLTEQKRNEEVAASEKLMRSVLDQAVSAIVTLDGAGRIIHTSAAAGAIFGESPLFKTFTEMFPLGGQEDETDLTFSEDLIGEASHAVRVDFTRKDGKVIHLALHAKPLIDDNGLRMGSVVTLQDVTDFKKTEEILRRSETRYRIVAENSYDLVSWLSPEMDYLFVSPSCTGTTGLTPGQFEADPALLLKIMHPDDQPRYEKHVREFHRTMRRGEMEYRILHKNGDWRWMSHVCHPLFDGSNRFSGTLCSDRDITERRNVEAELRESRERLRHVLEGITDGYICMDREWRFVEINPAAERIVFHRPARELIGKVQWEVYPETVGKEFYLQYHKAAAEMHPVHFEAPSVIAKGKWFEIHAYPRGDLIEAYVRDITERKVMEEELRRSRDEMERRVEERTDDLLRANKLLEDVFSNVHILIAYLDRDLNYIRVNARFAQAAGRNPEFFTGKNFFRLFPVRGAEAVFRRVIDRGEAYHRYEDVFENPNDPGAPPTYWDWSLNPLEDSDGGVEGLIFTAVDKTSHVQAQEQARKASYIIENAGFGIAVVNPDTNTFEYANPAYAGQHGFRPQEVVGMRIKDMYIPELRNHVKEITRRIDEDGHAIFESVHVRKDGSRFPVLVNAVAVRDGKGKTLYRVIFTEDISQLKKAMDALQENQERLATVLETLPVGVWILDRKNSIIHANAAAQEIWAGEASQSIGEYRAWWADTGKPVKSGEWAGIRTMAGGGLALGKEIDIEAFDGSRKIILVSASPIPSREGDVAGSVVVFQDVSRLKQSEKELRRLAAVIEQAYENVMIADKNGVVEYVNPRFEEHTGYVSSDIVGKRLSAFRGGTYSEGHYKSLWRTIADGRTWTGRAVRKKKDGTPYEADTIVSPVRDSLGRVISTVVIERDVTEQVKLERQVRQAQKMEAIGTLAGGIAHDFNNIIAGIIGFTEMALEETPMGTPLNRRLSLVLKGAHRGRDLVKQILAFSRASEQEKKPLKISYVLEDALKFLRASIPSTIEIRKNILTHSDVILADRTEIHQVLLNLCTNAAQAMRDGGGVLEVILSETDPSDGEEGVLKQAKPEAYVKLSVRDSGCGMEPEVMERIFDPFFTTKRPGEGTGLGLSVVHGIVKRHEGLIHVESAPGKGSTFHLYFPKLPMEDLPVDLQKGELPRGKGRILFIDDEDLLVEMNRGRLEGLGYEVTTETDALRAFDLFRADPGRYDLVITDYTMPQMTGIELAREMLAIRPEMPILLCSGLDELVSLEEVKKAGIREFLPKAAGKRELVRVIQALMAGNSEK